MSSIPSPSLFSVLKFRAKALDQLESPLQNNTRSQVPFQQPRQVVNLSADAVPEQLLAIQCLTCRLFIAIQIRGMSFFKLAPIPVVFLQVPIAKQGHIIL